MILLMVLYRRETWSMSLKEEHILKLSDNMVLKKHLEWPKFRE
jgi:hypothetical protein